MNPKPVDWPLLRRDPHHRPDKLAWSAAPFIHAASRAMRWEIYRAYGHFIEAYYEAKEKLTAGDLTACFPTGCFPPPLPFLRLPTPA